MKSPEQQLTEWTDDAIHFDSDDGLGVMRLYTRAAWETYCRHLHVMSGGWVDPEPNGIHSKEDGPDRKDTVERAISAFRSLISDSNFGASGFLKWQQFTKNFFNPQRMLRFENKSEIANALKSLMGAALDQALSLDADGLLKGIMPGSEEQNPWTIQRKLKTVVSEEWIYWNGAPDFNRVAWCTDWINAQKFHSQEKAEELATVIRNHLATMPPADAIRVTRCSRDK